MYKYILHIMLFVSLSSLPLSSFANIFTKTEIDGLWMQYVRYNVWSDEYTLKVAISDSATSLSKLAREYNGITAINGVFFCPADYSSCWWVSNTINERIIQGSDQSFYTDTWDRGVFGWTEEGIPLFHQTNKINPDIRSEIFEGLGNFPILYADGKNMIEQYHDNGLYDNKMKAKLPRHFICANQDKTWIIFGRTYSTSLDDLAPKLYKLGCWDALNLDAGNSSKFMYNGNELLSSWRAILDGFVIEHKDINVAQIENDIDTLIRILKPRFQKIRTKYAVSQLEWINKQIHTIRNEIYDTHSYNEIDNAGNIIGYTIDMQDFKALKRVYSINILEKKINHLIWELQNGI